jgi:hypothetical protein
VVASSAPIQHGLLDGDPIRVLNVAQNQYNGSFNVTVIDQFTIQYTISAPGTPQTSGALSQWNVGPYLAVAGAELFDINYVQDPANGNVYSVSYTTGNDYGNPIDFSVVTPRWDGGTMHEKFIMRASIVSDKTASNLLVRHSEDDYQTWSQYRPVSMAARWPNISALGMIYRMAVQLRHTDPTPQRVEAIEIEVEVGV